MKYFIILLFTCSFLFVNNSMAHRHQIHQFVWLKSMMERSILPKFYDDGRELLLKPKLRKIYIPKSEVKRISKIDDVEEIKDGELEKRVLLRQGMLSPIMLYP